MLKSRSGAETYSLLSHHKLVCLALLLWLLGSSLCFPQPSPLLKSVRVNRVVLHYTDAGRGPAVVFVHGGMEDYRAWEAQVAPLSKTFRVITYSRRYNFPNQNPLRTDTHSAIVDAEDLAALVRTLKLGRVHLVGHSYGAYVSMFLAIRHPELVRSLVLSEPPLMKWLNDIPNGKPLLDDFMDNMWLPCGQAFRKHDPESALRITVDWFGSHEFPRDGHPVTYAGLPAADRKFLMQDIKEWQALTTSRDAFPSISREQVSQIRKPVLLLSGSRSVAAFRLVADELARTLPSLQFVVLDGATHEMWSEVPQELTAKISRFLPQH
jgi:pimeloyl-ACP methyl ester carboxylesterase